MIRTKVKVSSFTKLFSLTNWTLVELQLNLLYTQAVIKRNAS